MERVRNVEVLHQVSTDDQQGMDVTRSSILGGHMGVKKTTYYKITGSF